MIVHGRKLVADSMHRYRATASERRLYGGSTVTDFWVGFADDPSSKRTIRGYGATPGERKTDAMRKFARLVEDGSIA